MKSSQFVLLAVLAAPLLVRAQDAPSVVPGESPAAPVSSPTTARILGNLPDGTPPPPAPPKPVFVVPAADIQETRIHEQGGRKIIVRKIAPIPLPPPPEPAQPAAVIDNAAFKARVAEFRTQHPRANMLALGATVYRFKDSPPRTLVRYWPGADSEPVTFWSSADFSLLSGVPSFVGSDGATRSLLMMWGNMDTVGMAAMLAAHGREYRAPIIPAFPDGLATFSIVGQQPGAEILASIQSLHDLYNNEHTRLKTAYEGRERARLQREADLKANPPQPRDIVLNHWRIDAAGQASTTKGAAR